MAGLFGLNVNVCKTETLVTSRTRMEKMRIEDRCTNILSLVEHFMCRGNNERHGCNRRSCKSMNKSKMVQMVGSYWSCM